MADAVAVPTSLEVIVGETRNIQVDFAGVLGANTAVFQPQIIATDLDSREEVSAWAVQYGSITLTGTLFSFTLLTSGLRTGTEYMFRLTCSVGAGPSSSSIASESSIVVNPSLVTWSQGNQTVTVQLVIKVIY